LAYKIRTAISGMSNWVTSVRSEFSTGFQYKQWCSGSEHRKVDLPASTFEAEGQYYRQ
jgi:hypothetical protein